MAGILFGILFIGLAGSQETPAARARALLEEGKPGEALPILLELYRGNHADANLCQQIGVAYTALEDFPHAEKFFREAARLNSGFWPARKNLGTVLWFQNRKEESEREFLAVAKALPADPVPHLYLGLAAHARRQFARARQEFEKAGALALENPEVAPAVIESFLATRNADVPAKIVEPFAADPAANRALLVKAGALFLQYGEAGHAVSIFEKICSAGPGDAESWRMLAEAYDRKKQPEQAYRAYTRAIDADPNAPESYLALAEFASAHANNDYALQVVERGLARLPGSSLLLVERGILRELGGNRAQAESDFRQAGKAKPDWALPLLALGVSQLETGHADEAAQTFRQAQSAEPRESRAYFLYATALSRTGGENSAGPRGEAIAAVRKAIQLNSSDARSHTLLGQLELASGNPAAAALAWQTALKIQPEEPTALYQLGLLYRKQGKTAESRRLLDQFQQVKGKARSEEQSLVEILRVAPAKAAP